MAAAVQGRVAHAPAALAPRSRPRTATRAVSQGGDRVRPLDKATPVIHDSELVSRVLSAPPARDCPAAFFSTELRGIVTHPAFMLVHVDDHMVHRGHAVFETCVVVDGHVYQLEAHLDRFFASCEAARVDSPLSREDVRRVVLHTAAAARALDGHIRLWASAGRGTFGVSPRGCARGTLYCVAIPGQRPPRDMEEGWRVVTATVRLPVSPTVKSTNYLQNALAQMEAEDQECDTAVFVDAEGYVTEGPTMNVAVLTEEGDLLFPPFDRTLPGITAKRVMELAKEHVGEGAPQALSGVRSVQQRPFTLAEAKRAREVMCLGTTTWVTPVHAWDGKPIADGTTGLVTMALRALLERDAEEVGPLHTEVPYGYLTNMRGL